MAPTAIDSSNAAASQPIVSKQVSGAQLHPLDDITVAEHNLAVKLIRAQHKSDGIEPWFKAVQRQEPRKAILLPWLDAYHDGQNPTPLPRKVEAIYIEPKTAKIHEVLIDVASEKIENSLDRRGQPPHQP